MSAKQAPSWLTPELRARWEAHEAAARERAMRAKWKDVRGRMGWAACATVISYPLAGMAALTMGMPVTWETAAFLLAISSACGLSVLAVDTGTRGQADRNGGEASIEPPRTIPLVPPNQGSARMRPDDGGRR